jgi:hypothetical protein
VSALDVIPAEMQEVWFVASQSEPGVWRKVTRTAIGLWGCSCPWGENAAERLNVKPCAHLRAVADYLAAQGAQVRNAAEWAEREAV